MRWCKKNELLDYTELIWWEGNLVIVVIIDIIYIYLFIYLSKVACLSTIKKMPSVNHHWCTHIAKEQLLLTQIELCKWFGKSLWWLNQTYRKWMLATKGPVRIPVSALWSKFCLNCLCHFCFFIVASNKHFASWLCQVNVRIFCFAILMLELPLLPGLLSLMSWDAPLTAATMWLKFEETVLFQVDFL